MRLLYTTSDRSFSELATLTLEGEGIEVHVSDVDPALSGLGSPLMMREYRIYLLDEEHYARANELLLEIGAARDEPPSLPPTKWFRWVCFLVGLAIAAMVLLGR